MLLGLRRYFWESYLDLELKRPAAAHEVTPPPPPGKLATSGPDILYEHPNKRLPRAVMFRDSFATWLIPMLSENFSRILFSWQYTFNREIVEREHPDVVIQEMVEIALMSPTAPTP